MMLAVRCCYCCRCTYSSIELVVHFNDELLQAIGAGVCEQSGEATE